jgi:cytosine/uracil/thiamine/allantoin permease
LHKITELVSLPVTANGPGALRFWLALAMIVSYLAMMAFLIYCARHATQIAVVTTEFSPAMIALASCMAFSVALTGLFVCVRHGN